MPIDDLRIALIIAGVFVLLAIYLWEKCAQWLARHRSQQGLDIEGEGGAESDQSDSRDFVVLFVNAPYGEFNGDDIRYALTTQGLRYNPSKGVFEYPHCQYDYGDVLFTVANMVNPGVFPDENLVDFSSPGMAFLMVLPVPAPVEESFDKMLQIANQAAAQLNGRLLDQHHAILTRQGINRMRQRLVAGQQDEILQQQSM